MIRKFAALLCLFCICLTFGSCGETADPSSEAVSSVGQQSETETDSASDTNTDSSATTSSTSSTSSKKSTAQEILEQGEYLVALTDQKNSRIVVCDLAVEDWSDDKAVVWEINALGNSAGVKFRDNAYWGGKVVVYCGGTRAVIASYDTKKVLLDTKNAPGNSHSVELLPNGVLVVAGSTSNEVRIFGAGKITHSDAVSFPSAHGVLWDPANELLWIGGDNRLQAFRITGSATEPKFSPVEGMVYHPNNSIHDLSPVYGDPDSLLLTGSSGVVKFDKNTGKVSYDYTAGGFLKTQSYVPGVGNYESGVYAFTTIRDDTLTYKEWGTDQVGVYVPLGGANGKVLMRQNKSDAYYKARVFNFDYQ